MALGRPLIIFFEKQYSQNNLLNIEKKQVPANFHFIWRFLVGAKGGEAPQRDLHP